ncbi:hypothetical protein DXB79_16125 [Bacteroides fragilis]|uniref:Uncharacterized protein n=1 Tax=Bacteroides fragilis TaxID=817 RepID=A0A5C6LDT0_BACFG|nr:hypothetical protein F9003_12890 [Bacteroides fragilis]RGL77813.1 hypothetical protein DXC49_04815 [Bacteroides fragilis]RGM85311.1 hypothetical protein DXB89_13045 [Bacteroides fragilis]RGN11661.1 hypothetical protein DXB79_16125 [Bacteroides fragilis]RHI21480.1 hypothetical protein DW176_04110 [Bacteroides fragilis]
MAKASGQRQNESKFIGFRPKSVHLHTYTINLRHRRKVCWQMQAFFRPTFRTARNESILRPSDYQIVKWSKRNFPPVK